MKTGLFFGSFNPIHVGHLIIANSIFDEVDLREIWFIVSPQNPHKRDSKSLAHEFDRMDMVEIAISDDTRFRAMDIEFHLPKPNFTIDTLAYLTDKHPKHEFFLIIGEDNLLSFPHWKNYQVILDNYPLLVYPRTITERSKLISHHHVTMVDAPLLDISASYIRKCIKEGRSLKYLVPDKVIQFIRDRSLYK
ncbi:MAG TPA: nicotinate (nicotinamide) nucleotide adenylyltransferase [Cyclobacteriaceae bacterium]|nr:nicotinate (nicotinamide) nucleotide adenylyltransferase [Cyclobacteriaceae bacterium]